MAGVLMRPQADYCRKVDRNAKPENTARIGVLWSGDVAVPHRGSQHAELRAYHSAK